MLGKDTSKNVFNIKRNKKQPLKNKYTKSNKEGTLHSQTTTPQGLDRTTVALMAPTSPHRAATAATQTTA
jgi:hypothetical protein